MKSINTERSSVARVQAASSKKNSIKANGLYDLMIYELKDIYWAEKALVKAIPKMIKNASADELAEALSEHLNVTVAQVDRLEQVFKALNEKATAKKCEAMAGLLKEAVEIMSETQKGMVRDAAIISVAQKVEHYEIASYGTLCTFAKTLGENAVASMLHETLVQEKAADELLTQIAESLINAEAAEGDENMQSNVATKTKQK